MKFSCINYTFMHLSFSITNVGFGEKLPCNNGQPDDDSKYGNYLLMLEISDYLLAPEISLDEVPYVKSAIKDHHRNFTTLYPIAFVPPKFH